MLLVGAALAILLAVVIVVLATSGSSGSPRSATNGAAQSAHGHHSVVTGHHAAASSTAPGTLHVVVLNSTEINGLAHRLASALQEHGFSQAQALAAHPTGAGAGSVVEYAPGYTSEAEGVARALGMEASAVRPLESATQPLAPGASVVVVAGSEAANGSTG